MWKKIGRNVPVETDVLVMHVHKDGSQSYAVAQKWRRKWIVLAGQHLQVLHFRPTYWRAIPLM